MKVCAANRYMSAAAMAVGLSVALAGCYSNTAAFRPNLVYVSVTEKKVGEPISRDQKQSVADVLTGLFGAPDEPHLPAGIPEVGKLVNLSALKMAAGPVGRNQAGIQSGLFREHCSHCHGVTGDGLGPTAAFLNPYPRDFRMGIFKFKSTPKGSRPTSSDLKKTIYDGIGGTAMPSFKLLADDQIDALVNYVKYLSLRGQVERELLNSFGEMEPGEVLADSKAKDPATGPRLISQYDKSRDGVLSAEEFAAAAKDNALLAAGYKAFDASGDGSLTPEEMNKGLQSAFLERIETVKGAVEKVAKAWMEAETASLPIPAPPSDWESPESIARGNALFHGPIAVCVKCHGETALGDGQANDFDEWTKDWYDPQNAAKSSAAGRQAGALPVRNIIPRNLRAGIYRGGRRPVDLYWRIVNGIDGTPMPAASMKAASDPAEKLGLTSDDVWRLIAYVRSLPDDPLSKRVPLPANMRETR